MQSLRNGDLPTWGRRAEGGGLAGGAAVALAENLRLYLIFLWGFAVWHCGGGSVVVGLPEFHQGHQAASAVVEH